MQAKWVRCVPPLEGLRTVQPALTVRGWLVNCGPMPASPPYPLADLVIHNKVHDRL